MKFSDRTLLERRRRSAYTMLTVLHDAFIIFASLAIGYAINFPQFSVESFLSHQWKLVLYSIVLYTGLSAVLGVYRQAYGSSLRLQIAAAVRAYGLGTLLIFATLFLFRNTYYSNGALLTYVVIIPFAFLSGRFALDRVRTRLHNRKWGLEPTLIVLVDEGASEPLHNLATYPSIGFNVLSVLHAGPLGEEETKKRIADSIALHHPTCIVYTCLTLDSPGLIALLAERLPEGITVRLVSPEVHDALTRMRLYDFAGIAISGPSKAPLATVHHMTKRMFDFLVSTALLVITAPVLSIVALAIRLESSGGVFFRQQRSLTRGSKPVRVFKFRSMLPNGGEPLEAGTGDRHRSDEILFKSPGDPRITPIGRLIRKYSLDELPQLFNVLVGDMSLVGPRPLPVSDFMRLPSIGIVASLYERRSLVKPGLTGLWQVSGRSGLSFRQMVILDLYYAENQGFLFDLEILFETIPAVISGRGAY